MSSFNYQLKSSNFPNDSISEVMDVVHTACSDVKVTTFDIGVL